MRGGPDCRLSQIIEGPIRFFALCEHHCLPFYGVVYVGYISHEHIIGLSKLTRLVHLFSRRFEVQERIGQQIADTLNQLLLPHGVAVYIEAHHLCVEIAALKKSLPLAARRFGVEIMMAIRRCGRNFWRHAERNNDSITRGL